VSNRFEAEATRLTTGASGDVAALAKQMFLLGALFLRMQQRQTINADQMMTIDQELSDCTPVEDGRRTQERT
jgi:hypothetical protein